MALNRREFLSRAGWLSAAGFLGPGLFSNRLVQQAFAETIGDRYLVVLFLDGGNDGLNTVVPYDNGGGLRVAYEAARHAGNGGLRIPPAELAVPSVVPMVDANTGAQLGFHPGLAGLARLYDLGQVAVVQGCGYPEYSLSHEEARIAWQTGNPLGAPGLAGTGWVGRHLAAEYGPGEIPGIVIANNVAQEFRQTGTGVVATRRFRGFGLPVDGYAPEDRPFQIAALEALCQQAASGSQSALQVVGASGTATIEATQAYGVLHDLYESDRGSWSDAYAALGGGTATRLREVARGIYGVTTGQNGVDARFYQLENGGYDTHSGQGAGEQSGQHHRLLAEVGDALELFYADLADMGVADRTLTVVWSEFSRRVEQNDNGTDHGSQGPMLVIGGAVAGGLYGNFPNIAPEALDQQGNSVYSQDPGEGFRSTDFRDVYGTILKHWLNVPAAAIAGGPGALLPVDVGPAAEYWTVPDLDLPFLP